MSTVDNINTILFSGCVFISELDSNNDPTGFTGSLESTQLSIATEVEEKKITSRQCDKFGQTHASVIMPTGAVVAITLLDHSARTLAMNLLGTATENVVAANPAATEENPVLTSTLWVKLAHRNIDASGFTGGSATSLTDYTVGVDFELNAAAGMVRRIEGGAILDGDEIFCNYATLGYTEARVDGGTKSQTNVSIRLEGVNQVDGSQGTLLIPKAVLRPDGEMDFMSGEFLENALTGDIVTVPGSTVSYTFSTYS